MRTLVGALGVCLSVAMAAGGAAGAECEANGDALGVARVIEVDPAGGPKIGTYQYSSTLDLEPGEVVLTFDDGPHHRNTARILDALDAECVKATFFPVGIWARKRPEVLRDVAARGHTIGAHSWSHPNLSRLPLATAKANIEKGFDAIAEAVGEPIAPFLRFPGLNDSRALTDYAAERDYAVFSCDIGTDDWRNIGAQAILTRTLQRLERRGSGILLFHDTKNATAAAIPVLLRELKQRGYRIAHVVPKPAGAPDPQEPAAAVASVPPRLVEPDAARAAPAPAVRTVER